MATPGEGDSDPEHAASDNGELYYQIEDSPQPSTATPRNTQKNISADDDDEEDELNLSPLRPNRFLGPPSTWRKRTAPERTLIASINQQRAADLSLHLHAVHNLKTRLHDPDKAKPFRPKKSWIQRDENGKLPWYPRDSWTAWPLPAGDVPRMGERFGAPWGDFDEGTYRRVERWRPGGEMEGEVFAAMLRRGKEGKRRAEREEGEVAGERVEIEVSSSEDSDSDDTSDDDDRPLVVGQRRTKVPDAATSTSRTKAPAPAMSRPQMRQVMLDDDDEAFELLEPMVHHITSKLDTLLTGLHTSFKGRSRKPTARSKPVSKCNNDNSKTSRSATPSQSRPSLQTKEGAAEQEDDNNEPPPPKPKRIRRPVPRDWSEVIAIATMTGWNPSVVDRATRRCAALFGERIEYASTAPKPESAPSRSASNAPPPDDKLKATKLLFSCPVSSCKRRDEVFAETWRWREHLKRVHKWERERVGRMEAGVRAKHDVQVVSEDGD